MKFNQYKLEGKRCKLCRNRQAKFLFRRQVKWDRGHDICMRCFRSLRDGMQAERMVEIGQVSEAFSLAESSWFFRQALEQPAVKTSCHKL